MKYQVALKTGGYLSNNTGSTTFSLATAKKYAAEFSAKHPKVVLKVTPDDMPHHLIRWDVKALHAVKAPFKSAVKMLESLEKKPRKNPIRKATIKKLSKVRTPTKSFEIHAHTQHVKAFKQIAVYYDKNQALSACKHYVKENPNDTVKLVLVY